MELSDDDLVELVLARFEPLLKGGEKLLTLSKLADKPRFAGFNESQLSTGYREAFRRGLVELRRAADAKFHEPERNDALQEELFHRFRPQGSRPKGMHRPIVIKSRPSHESNAADLARDIGWTFADWVRDRAFGSEAPWVGVGPGQSVYRVTERFRDKGPVVGNNVTFASLTGRFNARSLKERNVVIDADMNAARMGIGMLGHANYALLGSLAVLPEKPSERAPLVSRTWMAEDLGQGSEHAKERSAPPFRGLDCALLGVGILSDKWRFGEACGEIGGEEDPILEALDELKRVSNQISDTLPMPPGMPRFTPVGDIACHLFAVDPPHGVVIPQEPKAQLQNLLERINSRVLTVTPERLLKTNLWIVAGGVDKSHALRHILRKFHVERLATDDRCAEAILTGVKSVRPPRG